MTVCSELFLIKFSYNFSLLAECYWVHLYGGALPALWSIVADMKIVLELSSY